MPTRVTRAKASQEEARVSSQFEDDHIVNRNMNSGRTCEDEPPQSTPARAVRAKASQEETRVPSKFIKSKRKRNTTRMLV